MDLSQIRDEIDRLDLRILQLLNERMELALRAKRFKSRIEDHKREKELLDRLGKICTGLIGPGFLQGIYRQIFEESKKLQQIAAQSIAFKGDHGAYGEIAAKAWNSEFISMPCKSFEHVFEGVGSGVYHYGIVPVENTLGGVVGEVNRLIIDMDLFVAGAVKLAIHHSLLALPGTDPRDIRKVYSHPQALAQCREFLSRNNLEPVSYTDTAGAAKMLADRRPDGCAAIASPLCSDLYGLDIIKEQIEDLDRNKTRFLVLSKEQSDEQGEKCSVIFSTEHKAGTLFRVLDVFASRNINLTRIESIPSALGNYVFFLDFIGSDRDADVLEALEEAVHLTDNFRLMGCYKERQVG